MQKAVLSTREKRDQNARRYGVMEWFSESLWLESWRKDLFSRITGASLLEVDAGTEKSLPYYLEGLRVTAIDFTEEMLKRTRRRAAKLGVSVELRLMDAQSLGSPTTTSMRWRPRSSFVRFPIPQRAWLR